MKWVAPLIGLFWLAFAVAAWETHDALAIAVAVPVVTILGLLTVAFLWIIVGAAKAGAAFRRGPDAEPFDSRSAKPS